MDDYFCKVTLWHQYFDAKWNNIKFGILISYFLWFTNFSLITECQRGNCTTCIGSGVARSEPNLLLYWVNYIVHASLMNISSYHTWDICLTWTESKVISSVDLLHTLSHTDWFMKSKSTQQSEVTHFTHVSCIKESKISENNISMTGKLKRLSSERGASRLTKFSNSQKPAQNRSKFVREVSASIYFFRVSHGNSRARCELCSKLTIKTPERRHWCRSGFFIVKFEQIFHIVLVLLVLTLNK